MQSYISIDGWRSNIRFSSAHIIHEYEKCGRLHGHTYAVHAKIYGKTDSKGIILDFVIAGAVLHDIAKLFEMREEDGKWAFNNFLIDHIRVGGAELYARGFPEEVVHIVMSHAGGDTPRTLEAKIVDMMDNLDTTFESFGKEVQQLVYLLGDNLQ